MENYKAYYYSCQLSEVDMAEVCRYMGGGDVGELATKQAHNILTKSTPKAVYMAVPVKCVYDIVDFGLFKCKSAALAKNLEGCSEAVIFGATIGFEADREIMKHSSVSPVKALSAQAIGAVLVEQLCDNLCEDISKKCGTSLRPRFSPGYGDLDLEIQKELFNILNLPKNCGITLTDSCIMRPSKSVTAIAGINKTGDECSQKETKCSGCSKTDCVYRVAK